MFSGSPLKESAFTNSRLMTELLDRELERPALRPEGEGEIQIYIYIYMYRLVKDFNRLHLNVSWLALTTLTTVSCPLTRCVC